MINENLNRISFEKVKEEEFEIIRKLREINKGQGAQQESDKKPENLTNIETANPENLVGLAFSGGGIRSATFGLGVLEALKEKGLLKKIDYLSTVSGGGYIGAWLSANCKRTDERRQKQNLTEENIKPDPRWVEIDADWYQSIKHLRRYSNYLSPNLSLLSADTWSMFTVWLRNTLLIQLMIVIAIAALLLLPRLIAPIIEMESNHLMRLHYVTFPLFVYLVYWISGNLKQIKVDDDSRTNRVSYKPSFILNHIPSLKSEQNSVIVHVGLLMLISLGVSIILWGQLVADHESLKTFTDCLKFVFQKDWLLLVLFGLALILFSYCSSHDGIQDYAVAIPALIVLWLLLSAVLYLLSDWVTIKDEGGSILAFTWAPPMILSSLALSVNLLIGIQGNGSYEYVREWWSRFGAWLAICGMVWMLGVAIAFYGPLWSAMLYYEGPWISLGTGWIGTTIAGLLAGKSGTTGGTESKGSVTKAKEILAKIAPVVFIAGLFILVSLVLHLIIENLSSDQFNISKVNLLDNHWKELNNANWCWVVGSFFVCLVISFGILSWRLDINEFSLNAFYRNRLARCYLGATRYKENERKPHEFTGFDDDDDIKISELVDGNKTSSGPFHIVNCALNLGGSKDLSLHTRHSANFTVTPLFCGSWHQVRNKQDIPIGRINYMPTSSYGGTRSPSLGQAISVSGAAASPNMGYHTSAPVAFLMTLFNARLGWWFPNPLNSDCNGSSPTMSLWYLLLELFGIANEEKEFLAISDGGHFENLAALELIKRRCQIVIISDGECDPNLKFEGLANLIRICEVESLAQIEIDVRPIHPEKTITKKALPNLDAIISKRIESDLTWSENRCAVGKITYNDGSIGFLLYLKASMKGNEDTAVLQYKATHPDFPHESTGDQFYAEDQFESYRWLGQSITKELLTKEYLTAVSQKPGYESLKTTLQQLGLI